MTELPLGIILPKNNNNICIVGNKLIASVRPPLSKKKIIILIDKYYSELNISLEFNDDTTNYYQNQIIILIFMQVYAM